METNDNKRNEGRLDQQAIESQVQGVLQEAAQMLGEEEPGWGAAMPSQPAGQDGSFNTGDAGGLPPITGGAGNRDDAVVPPPRRKKTKRMGPAGVALLLVGCMVFGFFGGMLGSQLTGKRTVIYQSSGQSNSGNASGEGTTNGSALSLSGVVSGVKDSVVEVTTENVSYNTFFGQSITSGAGSGVIISEDGYIITNNHVVNGASSITIRLTNGESYSATLVGTDATTDVAVVKIEATGLVAAVLGDSDTLQVGDSAIAIGNPLGSLGGTVTEGIISALDRDVTIDGQTMKLLQTSAAVNPGNSGGGLFNIYGELVGIVNAKSSGTDVEGLGFAIPINIAREVAQDLIENGRVTGRPALGVNILEISTTEAAYRYGVNRLGVYITAVNDYSKAKSQLQAGDYIVSVDGHATSSSAEISSVLGQHQVGDVVEVQVIRDSRTITVSVELVEMQ